MPRRSAEGPVSHAKWPAVESFRSPASFWDVDDSTAQTVSSLNSFFGFRPPTTRPSPDEASRHSPDLPHLYPERTPELRQDTPSDARTRTSSFGPETPPTKFDSRFSPEPFVQPLTPARAGRSHLRSHSDSCSLQSLYPEALYRAGPEPVSFGGRGAKHHSYPDTTARPGDRPHSQSRAREAPSPHQNYTVALTRNNRAVTLVLTAGTPAKPGQPAITCYRQTSLPLGGPHAEFFKASEALALLQHMVNASSMSFAPFSKRERADLMHRMRTSADSMVLGEPCSNARAWTSFFSAELAAGRAWDAGTVVFPWRLLEKLMSSLNSECARKRRAQTRAAASLVRRETDDHPGPRGGRPHSQPGLGQMADPRPVALLLAGDPEASYGSAERASASSASPPPRTPTELHPPKLQLVSERTQSPPPPRIALLKASPCRQNLRRLHAASTPARLVFYDSIRTWPTSSHRARVRLPPCSRFLEMTADQGTDPHNPIVL